MPRPKILPENRVRAYRACQFCKASKIRCDAKVPCANCVRRGRSARCTYNGTAAPGSSARSEFEDRQERVAQQALSPMSQTSTAADRSPSSRSGGMVSSSACADAEAVNGVTEDQESPKEHFVTNSKGERVYIGENASLSFLDFLRHTLKPLVGSTAFTDGERHNSMIDADVREVPTTLLSPDITEKRALFQSYTEVSSGILHLFSASEAEALLDSTSDTTSPQTPEDVASMQAALAIGAQARIASPNDGPYAAMYFTRAGQVAFRDMLSNPSLGLVRLFLLLAFYTLGACRQDAASIYLGIASRSAVVLGLHQPGSWKRTEQGDEAFRLRIWHSLCILDVLTSSLLGRPCTVPRATRHSINLLPLEAEQPIFNAMLKGVALLDDICCILSRGVIAETAMAQGLLERLRSWCRDLPPEARRFSQSENAASECSERQAVFSRVYLSSVYYFAVILVTRPFLTEVYVSRIRQRSGMQQHVVTDPSKVDLAQVCLSSATFMGQLCRQLAVLLTTLNLPQGNLSLFKVWAFGAGLVLGFSILAGEDKGDLNEAFYGVMQLLRKIGETSPQSKMYSETLRAFAESIQRYQRLMSRETRRASEQYVEKLLVIDNLDHDMVWPVPAAREQPNVHHNWDSALPLMGAFLDLEPPDFALPPFQGAEVLDMRGWDNLGTQFCDNFTFGFGTGFL